MIPRTLALLAALALQAPAGGPLVSKPGGFRVDMPGKPTGRAERMDSPFGPMEGRSFASTRGKVAFFASFADFPPDVPDFAADKVLDRSIQGALGGVPGATPRATSDLKLGDVPGKEIEFSYPVDDEGDRLCRARYYLSGRRLYIVMLRGPAADVSRIAPAFFRSFDLFPPEGAAGPGPKPPAPSPLTTKPGPAPRPVATKVFTSAAGGFRVALAGKPREQTLVQRLPDGVVEAHLLVAEDGGVRRLVSYIDHPKPLPPEQVEAGLEDLVKGSIISGKGTLVSKRPIRLGDAPGREFEFDSTGPDGRPRFVRARAYLVGPRIYQVLIGGPKPNVAGKVGDAYLDSFSLIETSATRSGTSPSPNPETRR